MIGFEKYEKEKLSMTREYFRDPFLFSSIYTIYIYIYYFILFYFAILI